MDNRPIPINSSSAYPNASMTKRAASDIPDKKPVRKQEQAIVSGNQVRTRKPSVWRRAKHRMIDENGESLKEYAVDVLTMTLKNTISDLVNNGTDIMLYGEARHARSGGSRGIIGGVRNGNYVTYNSVSSYRGNGNIVRTGPNSGTALRRHLSLDDFIFETRSDANTVLDRMSTILEDCGIVTVGDLYDMCDRATLHTYYNYGWTDLSTAGVSMCSDGYLLTLPTPHVLD